jgi:vitamin B12 transporter
MKKSLIAGAVACAFTPAFAEDISTFDLGTIVVTPARAPQPLDTTLQSVTVISADDIAQAGQQTLPELLQTRGNVEVKTVGGPGQPAAVFIRGANSTHTLVLVDGVRLDNVTSGTTALEHIPLAQIDHIEILRAPASSLYGADAIGGVVQIFTKGAKGTDGLDISAGFGSYRTQNFGLGLRRGFGDTHLQIQLAHSDSQSFSATNARAGAYFNPDKDPYRNSSISAALTHTINPDNVIGLSVFQAEGTVHFDGYASNMDDTKIETLNTYSVFSRNRIMPNWQSQLRLSRGIDSYRFVNTASPSSTRSVQDQISWQNDLTLGAGRLSLGLERLDQRVTSTVNYDKKDRTVDSVFGVYQRDLGQHSVQLSARHDDNSQFGGSDTGNLAYGYHLNPAWRVTAGVGTAFKAPSFQDLYYPGYSNPNLKPERSMNQEVGLRYGAGDTHFSATYFDNRITDLIIFVFPRPENVNKARITGLELAYGTRFTDWNVESNLNLQHAVDERTGKRLQLRSEVFGTVAITRRLGAWVAGGELAASGDRFDSTTESPASRLPGYALVNLTANYAVSRQLTIQGRWNNVFDRQYELAKGYNTPGSNVFVGLNYQLQ